MFKNKKNEIAQLWLRRSLVTQWGSFFFIHLLALLHCCGCFFLCCFSAEIKKYIACHHIKLLIPQSPFWYYTNVLALIHQLLIRYWHPLSSKPFASLCCKVMQQITNELMVHITKLYKTLCTCTRSIFQSRFYRIK